MKIIMKIVMKYVNLINDLTFLMKEYIYVIGQVKYMEKR
jgi:hypothetical protein